MQLSKRILRCIGLIEKHGFKLARLEEQFYRWLEKNKIDPDTLDVEIDTLFHQHNGKGLIKELERRLDKNENKIDE